jgi:hypothetical protein
MNPFGELNNPSDVHRLPYSHTSVYPYPRVWVRVYGLGVPAGMGRTKFRNCSVLLTVAKLSGIHICLRALLLKPRDFYNEQM